MANKKFWYGLAAGAIGYAIYNKFKHRLKPFAIKSIGSALEIGSQAKRFIEDVAEEAKEGLKDDVRNSLGNDLAAADNDSLNRDIHENIVELKEQLRNMEKKINNF